MKIKDYIRLMLEKDASDLFYRSGGPARFRINGDICNFSEALLQEDDVDSALNDLATPAQIGEFYEAKDIDFGLYLDEFKQRFRISIFMQRNTPSIVIRQVKQTVKSFDELNLPKDVLEKLAKERRGFVLLTGSMGAGKSTTIASMLEYINVNSHRHILTIEEPIEFIFNDKNSIINQRELKRDVTSYAAALRSFTLESPDVLYIGNIRDYQTMTAALTAAETGVLVLSTLHTINAPQTIERIINFFQPYEHDEIALQLSSLLKGVISLRLIKRKDKKGMIPAYESMILTPTISRLIREGKIWEIARYIEDGAMFGMQTFNQSLVSLVKRNLISLESALEYSDSKDELLLAMKGYAK